MQSLFFLPPVRAAGTFPPLHPSLASEAESDDEYFRIREQTRPMSRANSGEVYRFFNF
jgi:hypothetical protein